MGLAKDREGIKNILAKKEKHLTNGQLRGILITVNDNHY